VSYNCTNYFKILPSPKSANYSCFHTTTISLLALCPALCPIRPLAPASLPCGRPHSLYRLISESRTTRPKVTKVVLKLIPKCRSRIVVNAQVSHIPHIFNLIDSCITSLFPGLQAARLMCVRHGTACVDHVHGTCLVI
jgi:hypothetical protein